MPETTPPVKMHISFEASPSAIVELAGVGLLGYLLSGDFRRDMEKLSETTGATLKVVQDSTAQILSQEKTMSAQLTDLDAQQSLEVQEMKNLTDNVATLIPIFNILAAAANSPTPMDVSAEIKQGAAILNGLQSVNSSIAAALAAQKTSAASSDGGQQGGQQTTPPTGDQTATPVIPAVPDGPASPDPSVLPGGAIVVNQDDNGSLVLAGNAAPADVNSAGAENGSSEGADEIKENGSDSLTV